MRLKIAIAPAGGSICDFVWIFVAIPILSAGKPIIPSNRINQPNPITPNTLPTSKILILLNESKGAKTEVSATPSRNIASQS